MFFSLGSKTLSRFFRRAARRESLDRVNVKLKINDAMIAFDRSPNIKSAFEQELEDKFRAFYRNGRHSCLCVSLLPHKNADGYDYVIEALNQKYHPSLYVEYRQQAGYEPVIVLDLIDPQNLGFNGQWPYSRFPGHADHPRFFRVAPLFCFKETGENVVPMQCLDEASKYVLAARRQQAQPL